VIAEWLANQESQSHREFGIISGYPRYLDQLYDCLALLETVGETTVVELACASEEALRRFQLRGERPGEDRPSVDRFSWRMEEYQDETRVVLREVADRAHRHILVDVGHRSIEESLGIVLRRLGQTGT
jgi:adenylate kinase family enzyme